MSDTIASLDMYCWPEALSKWEVLWDAIHQELSKAGISAPDALTFGRPIEEVWQDPNLLIGHCCGWPYVSKLRDKVRLIGRFDFGVSECPPGFYNSAFIVPKHSELTSLNSMASDTTRIAINGNNSQSGFRVLGELFNQPPKNVLITGSHRASIQAVRNGEAELAAIDAVTWEMAKEHEPAANNVKLVGTSAPRPGLPLITANTNHALTPAFFDAVQAAIAMVGKPLGILGFVEARDSDYEILL